MDRGKYGKAINHGQKGKLKTLKLTSVIGYGVLLNRLDNPVLMARPEPLVTEFDIHHTLEISVNIFIVSFLEPQMHVLYRQRYAIS